jgi:hypothetical protein
VILAANGVCFVRKVDAFLEGERDYTKIEGDTGPLVYPAGFLCVYSAVKFITGSQVFPAQVTSQPNVFHVVAYLISSLVPRVVSCSAVLRRMNSCLYLPADFVPSPVHC